MFFMFQVDELLEEFQYLLSEESLNSTRNVIHDTLNSYKLQVGQSVIDELASALSTSNPVYWSTGKGYPLATSFKRKKYSNDSFKIVEPIEYFLDDKDKSMPQYVRILKKFALDHHHLILGARGEEVMYKSF